MAEVMNDGVGGGARALARVVEPFHAITYYAPEMLDLSEFGYRGWWHAYFGYRPSPMGEVGPKAVTAAFYNFAPRMIERAVPGVWAIRSASDTTIMRAERVGQALDRIFPDHDTGDFVEAAALVRTAVDGAEAGGRVLFAAYADLDWPTDELGIVWHGTTLLREYRGDCHNIALAAAEVDPVASHVLMAGKGHGNRPTITAIRGWNDDEWASAVQRLVERGWAEPSGALTPVGLEARSEIERHTDVLASGPVVALGHEGLARFLQLMTPLVDHLRANGEVSGSWPPEHLLKPSDDR